MQPEARPPASHIERAGAAGRWRRPLAWSTALVVVAVAVASDAGADPAPADEREPVATPQVEANLATAPVPAQADATADFVHVRCKGERDATPLGAKPPALPTLCDKLNPAVNTAISGGNYWIDNFNHGATMAKLPDTYLRGYVGRPGATRHFLHKDHWMADLRSDSGRFPMELSSWMRPKRSFRPKANGSVVIEFQVATPIPGTIDVDTLSDSWPEFAIATAPRPSKKRLFGSSYLKNGLYFYESFRTAHVMGCRMHQWRQPICSFYRKGSTAAQAPDRLWEINQNGSDVRPGSEFGGHPFEGTKLARAWARCGKNDPDTVCRNIFRVTLTAKRIRIDVKRPGGSFVRYYESVPCNSRKGCSTGQMGRILNNPGGFYVYFAGTASRLANNEVLRFHWDRLAVNPPTFTSPTEAVNRLRVRGHTPAGYARSKFPYWIDANGDGENTRAEVLKAESTTAVTRKGGKVVAGQWTSYYDGRQWTKASDVAVDQIVHIEEAWRSGAKAWNRDTRRRFANDLGDPRTLNAITASLDRQKGSSGPPAWLPPTNVCRYVKEWVAVKHRWSLFVDETEKAALLQAIAANGCSGPMTVKKAKIVKAG